MFYHAIMCLWSFMLDIDTISRLTDDEKDLEIVLLRQQLRHTPGKRCKPVCDYSGQTHCLAGIGNWYGASGRSSKSVNRDDRRLMKSWKSGSCAWRRRTRTLALISWGGTAEAGLEVSSTTIRRGLLRHGTPPAPKHSRLQRSSPHQGLEQDGPLGSEPAPSDGTCWVASSVIIIEKPRNAHSCLRLILGHYAIRAR
jgi:hypothetical protein